MRKIRLRGKRDEAPGVQLTAMIDVLLVLILFFMVSSTLVKQRSIPVRLPGSRTATVQEKKAIEVTLRSDGKIFLDSQETTLETLPALLSRAGEAAREGVVIRGDEAISYARLVAVMDELNKAGVSRISMAAARK